MDKTKLIITITTSHSEEITFEIIIKDNKDLLPVLKELATNSTIHIHEVEYLK